MKIKTLLFALALGTTVPLGAGGPLAFATEASAVETGLEDLIRVSGLDQVFVTFGETIAASPEAQGLSFAPGFLEAWKSAAAESFARPRMDAALRRALDGQLTNEEMSALGAFYRSEFGQRITGIEAGVQTLSAEEQLAARDTGLRLLGSLPAESQRDEQIDEILELASAEVGRAMLAEAMRAMVAAIAMSGAQGDIEVPWAEVDAQLEMMLPAMEAEILATQRGITAFAYAALEDAEIEQYMEFLRTPAARKYYALIGYSVGLVVHDHMARFGETLAWRLAGVST